MTLFVETALHPFRWSNEREEAKQQQDTGAEHGSHAGKQAGVQPARPGGGEPQHSTPALVSGALPQLPCQGHELPSGVPSLTFSVLP